MFQGVVQGTQMLKVRNAGRPTLSPFHRVVYFARHYWPRTPGEPAVLVPGPQNSSHGFGRLPSLGF